jgi:hypothetical protein
LISSTTKNKTQWRTNCKETSNLKLYEQIGISIKVNI